MQFSHDYVDYASSDDDDYFEHDQDTAEQGIQSVQAAPVEARAEELRARSDQARARGPVKTKATARKLNTNVVAVDLGSLTEEANHIATGDPFLCGNPNCRTVLSSVDELLNEDPTGERTLEEGTKLWKCRFCDFQNIIEIDDGEKPVGKSQDYILERPEVAEAKAEAPLVVFCVDVSGSMGSRCTVPDGEKAPKSGSLPTRLQAVQSTIADQLQALARDNPATRVALVAFNSTVTIHGDGTSGRQQNISGNHVLASRELCAQFGTDYVVRLSADASHEQLTGALWNLKQGGQTALGPALVTSIAIAAQQPGSSVIVCTDGCANVGMGSLSPSGGAQDDAGAEWYQTTGEWALQQGVVVNVVSITDDGCRLELLGNVSDLSEGIVTLVNPLELSHDVADMVRRSPIATLVQARMFVHPGLRFLSDEETLEQNSALAGAKAVPEDAPVDDEKDREAPLHTVNQTQDVGNAFEDQKIHFEYAVKKETFEQYKAVGALPFQVQINYTRLDGAKMLRVITELKPITRDREDVRRTFNSEMVSHSSALKTKRLAKKGNYEAARFNTYLTGAWMSTNSRTEEQVSHTNEYLDDNARFDSMMQSEQTYEKSSRIRTADMSESDRRSARSSRRNDAMAVHMYSKKKKSRR